MINRGIKKLKTKPASANMVRLFLGTGYTTYWKGRAKPKRRGAAKASRPRPKAWASLVVFLNDSSKRKRSFHISWNGMRFADTPELDRLWDLEPAVYEELQGMLPGFNDRLIKAG